MSITEYTTHHRTEDFDLSPEATELLWKMEERHFWHRARNRWIARALESADVTPPSTFLEIGCGSGAVACALQRLGYAVTGVDTNAPLVRKAAERCPAATFFVADIRELAAGPYDAIGFFDVLEHVDEPELFLRTALKFARPGTVVVATVPALNELFDVVDRMSGHKKRYEAGELAALFERAGLERPEERGIFRSTLPAQRFARRRGTAGGNEIPADPMRVWRRHFAVPAWPVNATLDLVCRVESRFAFGAARNRAGGSLLCVGRVPSGSSI